MTHVQAKPLRGQEKQKLIRAYGKAVQINRKVYKIVYCEALLVDGQSVAGLCDSQNTTLYVVDGSDIQETLLHEIIHSEIAESGIRQTPGWTRDIEELVCEAVSQGISHTYRLKKK
jgi:hypothetical protein